jgi:hypothetical protein
MYGRLNHCLFKNIYWSEHTGLRRVILTENAAFKMREIVFKSINQAVHAGGTSCDLAKACCCLSNGRFFLPKLHFHGIQGVSEN